MPPRVTDKLLKDIESFDEDQLHRIHAKVLQAEHRLQRRGVLKLIVVDIKEYMDTRARALRSAAREKINVKGEITVIMCSGECKRCEWYFKEPNRKTGCIWELVGVTVRRRK